MDFNRKTIKTLLIVVFSCILFYLGVKNIGEVAGALGYFLRIFTPFIVGSAIAFIVNVPMNQIEYGLFHKSVKLQKAKRPISILITLIITVGVIVIAMYIIIPQIATTVQKIAVSIPDAITSFQDWITAKTEYWNSLQNLMEKLSLNWEDLANNFAGKLKDAASGLFNFGFGAVANIASAAFSFLIGFIFSVYVLMRKEKLASQGKQVMWALLPEEKAEKLMKVLHLTCSTFSSFISGQCLEACILGSMFFVTMIIIGLPYATLISVTIAFLALIPMIGSFIGLIIGALLLVMVNPTQALIFIIMFIVLVQIESNLIYPHVVGNSVGLPSIWVLMAITVGGKLFGIVGMIIFIPICSVAYSLFRTYIKERLVKKNIPQEVWHELPATKREKRKK